MRDAETDLIATEQAGRQGVAFQERSLMFGAVLVVRDDVDTGNGRLVAWLIPLFGHCTGRGQEGFQSSRELCVRLSKAADETRAQLLDEHYSVTNEPTFSPMTTR